MRGDTASRIMGEVTFILAVGKLNCSAINGDVQLFGSGCDLNTLVFWRCLAGQSGL
jgi:hypothetical protein